MQPDNQIQEVTTDKTIKFTLKQTGEVTFEGDVSHETLETVQQVLDSASFYRQQQRQTDQHKNKESQEFDSIIVIVSGCVLSLIIFGTYATISTISNFFNQSRQGVTNVR